MNKKIATLASMVLMAVVAVPSISYICACFGLGWAYAAVAVAVANGDTIVYAFLKVCNFNIPTWAKWVIGTLAVGAA